MQPTGTWKYAKIVRCEHILLRQVQRLLSFSALSSSSASSTLLLLTRQLILDGLVGWLVGWLARRLAACLPFLLHLPTQCIEATIFQFKRISQSHSSHKTRCRKFGSAIYALIIL